MTRDVAEHFGKRHDNILNDIGRLLLEIQEQGWFIETEPSIASNFGLFEIGVLISATLEAELNFQLCPQF